MTKEELLKAAYDAMMEMEESKAMEIAHASLEAGVPSADMLSDGFGKGIRALGDLFERGEVFLPELIVAADIMQGVSDFYESKMQVAAKKAGRIVLSTVEGDVHDIGKGIVAALMKSQGYEIIDLGRDRSVSEIIEAAQREGANFIGTSALLTTTMQEQKKLEQVLKKEGLKGQIRTIVGGAPITQRWADRIHADIYAEDANAAIRKVDSAIESMITATA